MYELYELSSLLHGRRQCHLVSLPYLKKSLDVEQHGRENSLTEPRVEPMGLDHHFVGTTEVDGDIA